MYFQAMLIIISIVCVMSLASYVSDEYLSETVHWLFISSALLVARFARGVLAHRGEADVAVACAPKNSLMHYSQNVANGVRL